MALARGIRFGSYEIAEAIGAGGMGEVYRATDSNLKRDVAIKVLPTSFASDTDRLARFQREAEVLASLNHPNIAHIYGLERGDGVTALVMELVEGATLAERIALGPLPVEEALGIAQQLAAALEAAHARGIVHRDLKPANIKLAPDGTVKVLDFGIAKALETPMTSGPQAPPLTTPAMTQAGVVLGTAAYMSPEQARGKQVDQRADIWAFGCVLYEMLTGQPAFGGEDVTITLARVLERGADMSALPETISPDVRQAIKLCLQKDLKKRIADIRDVRLALEGAFETAAARTAASAPPSTYGRLAWIVAFAVAVLGIGALAVPALRHVRETPPLETRVDIVTPATDHYTSFALSPDGREIVFVASGDGPSRLWLRSLARAEAQPLEGTEGARFPFWSPDGRSIGFFAGGWLKRLDLGNGVTRPLTPASNGSGGTWNADGVIVFAPSLTGPLMRVSAAGGEVAAVTVFEPQQSGHTGPHFLPDGRRFLFNVLGGADTSGIYLGGLDGGTPTRLTPSDGDGVYLPAGWVLWARDGTLLAQRLDLAQRALMGEPVTLADVVGTYPRFHSAVSVAAAGLVAYRAGAGNERQLTWIDRSGTVLGTVGDPSSDDMALPRVAPDDSLRVAVTRTMQGNRDLWLLDGARARRITTETVREDYPLWSPDGKGIVFRIGRTGPGDLYYKLVDSLDPPEPLVVSEQQNKSPNSWSMDRRYLLYTSVDPETNADLWVKPMMGDGTEWVFLKTSYREVYGAFSPDGRWVAYQSNESGRAEVYVRPFVPRGGEGSSAGAAESPSPVSTAGGIVPKWRPDGQELYYLSPAGEMMAAPITVTGGTLVPGTPVMLFPTRIMAGGEDTQQGPQYDVAPDGRFLINMELDDDAGAPITLIQNWNPEATQ